MCSNARRLEAYEKLTAIGGEAEDGQGKQGREDVVVVVERRSWSGEFVVAERRSWREADVTEN